MARRGQELNPTLAGHGRETREVWGEPNEEAATIHVRFQFSHREVIKGLLQKSQAPP